MQHHEFSPSKLGRLEACPGSYNLGKGLPEIESEYAEIGTKLHKAMETGDITDLTPSEVAQIEWALNREHEIISEHGEPLKTLSELKVSLLDKLGEVITSGSADKIYIYKNHAVLIDYKFGFIPVHPEAIQLKVYGAAIVQKFDLDYIDMHVIQPNNKQFANAEHRLFLEDVRDIQEDVDSIIFFAKQPTSPMNPGDHCRYCPAISICPHSAKQFEIVRNNTVITAEATDDFVAEMNEKADLVEKYIVEWRKELKKRIEKNGSCAGYRFEEKPGNREITDTKAVFSALQEVFTADEFLQLCKLPVTNLESAAVPKLQAAYDLKTQKAGKEKLAEFIGDWIERGKPKTSIVKAS